MKTIIIGIFFLVICAQLSYGQERGDLNPAGRNFTAEEQELINLSKDKWQWMADKDGDKVADLFHEKAMFVHMGGSWGKEQELKAGDLLMIPAGAPHSLCTGSDPLFGITVFAPPES